MTQTPQPSPKPGSDFGTDRERYRKARLPYPDEVIDYLDNVASPLAEIVDLGAGTGLVAIELARRGHIVTAIEPDQDMARDLCARPGVRWIKAPAEATGLPENCSDHVVCAQSFHWFDTIPALGEIARILRPAGLLSVVWKSLDVDDSTTRQFSEFRACMIGPPDDKVTSLRFVTFVNCGFEPVAESQFAAPFELTPKTIFSYLASQRNCVRRAGDKDAIASEFVRIFGSRGIRLRSDINILTFRQSLGA